MAKQFDEHDYDLDELLREVASWDVEPAAEEEIPELATLRSDAMPNTDAVLTETSPLEGARVAENSAPTEEKAATPPKKRSSAQDAHKVPTDSLSDKPSQADPPAQTSREDEGLLGGISFELLHPDEPTDTTNTEETMPAEKAHDTKTGDTADNAAMSAQEQMQQKTIRIPIQYQEGAWDESSEKPSVDLSKTLRFPAEFQNGKPVVSSPAEGAEDAEAAEEDGVDNLVQFHPAQDPETLGEALHIGKQRMRGWWSEQKDQLHPSELGKTVSKEFTTRIPITKEQKPRPTVPDKSPKELVGAYGRDIKALRLGRDLAIGLTGLIGLIALLPGRASLPFTLPAFLQDLSMLTWISLGLFLLLCYPTRSILKEGFRGLLTMHLNSHVLPTLAAVCVVADAVTLELIAFRPYSLPLFAPCALVLCFQIWGKYSKQAQLLRLCRTASKVATPERLQAEEGSWQQKTAYRLRTGAPEGFGSQVQVEDDAARCGRITANWCVPLSLVYSLLIVLTTNMTPHLLWSLSALFAATATLSTDFCFALPFRGLSERLYKEGVALAGWGGVEASLEPRAILLEEDDLFPPGTVTLRSFEFFATAPPDKIISLAASLIRAAGSALDPVFFGLVRTEGGSYIHIDDLEMEDDGLISEVAGETVLLGTLAFLSRKGVLVPDNLRVPAGLYCAVNGMFAAQFVLEYRLSKMARPALATLLSQRIMPILIGVDMNLSPVTLRKLYPFAWEKLTFPSLLQRRELAQQPQPEETDLVGLLTMRGLMPMATLVTGAQRLRTGVRLCTLFSGLSSVMGFGLMVYLGLLGAITAVNAVTLSVFLLLWLLPVMLIAGWVNQF